MKNPELYKRTVDILYQAYFNDTLVHGNCHACAVGNIVAANMGWGYTQPKSFCTGNIVWDTPEAQRTYWVEERNNGFVTWFAAVRELSKADGNQKKQIKATGYSIRELSAIEIAFERANCGESREDRMFNGLVAVLDCLKEIHEVEDEVATESVKPFKSHYEKLTA
jgi:hypothetical protein